MSTSSNNSTGKTIETVNPITLPIVGRTLIEASAGTGKTYTITSIILRLLLNHLLYPKTSEPYQLQQILVVTFTRDSTAELKERIQKRLSEARQAFASQESKDSFLIELLAQLDGHHKAALDALKLAEQSIHEAQIFTIHQFCLRLIKQFALETQQWFSLSLVEDDQDLIKQFCQSFWRKHLYFSEGKKRQLYQRLLGKTPDNVETQLKQWRSRAEFHFSGLSPLSFDALLKECIDTDTRLAQSWPKVSNELYEFFKSGSLKANSYKPANIPTWFEKINHDIAQGKLIINTSNIHYFSLSKVEGALKKHQTLAISSDAFEFLTAVEQLTESFNRLTVNYYQYQKRAFESYLSDLYQDQQALTFDSVIRQTAKAIQSTQGKIAAEIKGTLRIGLIDEFQDTDASQYSIFKSLFADESQALMMIGDPKQAIYSFRGGDLHTYLKARSEADNLYTLSTNWRSSKGLIEAINQLYLNSNQPFYSNDIDFLAVQSSPEQKPALQVNNQTLEPLLFFQQHEQIIRDSKKAKAQIALNLASMIYQWLNEATLENKSLQLDDFAILVRSAAEADIIKAALEQYQLNSSYFSDKEHIFETDAALSLRLLLNAIEQPRSIKRLSTLLATPLFKKPLAYIQKLSADQLEKDFEYDYQYELETWRDSLIQAAQSLKQHNLFQALHGFLKTHHIQQPSNQGTDKSRRQFLTHFFHLIELMHEQFPKEKKLHVLVNYLLKQQQQPNTADNNDIRKRIEDTQKRISIYTLHKCKGLQFKIVFLPFISFAKSASRDAFYFYHDGEKGLKAYLKTLADDRIKSKAEIEVQQENARLLYVGLTRAINHCVVYLEPNYKVQHTELGRLIHADTSLDDAIHYLPTISQSKIYEMIEPSSYIAPKTKHNTQRLQAADFQRQLDKPWQITSYTALTAKSHSHSNHFNSSHDNSYDLKNEDHQDDTAVELTETTSNFAREHFPKGAQIGIFWHDWLEHMDFDNPIKADELSALLQRYQFDPNWHHTLVGWGKDVLAANLDNGLSLSKLKKHQKLPEMEFLLSLKPLDAHSLNSALETSPICAPQPLRFDQVQGFMTGFIDLVFEYHGQYFVLDYKSNYLGMDIQNYQQEHLLSAMQSHRYDVQLLLYCVALDIHLSKTLMDYDYNRHFGGAYYLFLRGMKADSNSGVYFHKPDYEVIERLKTLLVTDSQGVFS